MDFTSKKNQISISALDTEPTISKPSPDESIFVPSKEGEGMGSKLQFGLKVVRYVLVIYLVIYVTLLILNQLDMLPEWLKNIFTPFDIIGITMNQDKQKKIEKENKNKEQLREKALATKLDKDKPSPERIAPTRFVPNDDDELPRPDRAGSSTQSSKIANKPGYCYIGEDRGFRSCVRVRDGDKCMSGEIFENQAQCIDPNMRA